MGGEKLLSDAQLQLWYIWRQNRNFALAVTRRRIRWIISKGYCSPCRTNNHGDTADDIAEGIKTICSLIRDKQPQAYLILTSLLPRGHQPNPLRERNGRINDLLADFLKGNSRAQLVYLDPEPGFVRA